MFKVRDVHMDMEKKTNIKDIYFRIFYTYFVNICSTVLSYLLLNFYNSYL